MPQEVTRFQKQMKGPDQGPFLLGISLPGNHPFPDKGVFF
jgi:hypothetical protein